MNKCYSMWKPKIGSFQFNLDVCISALVQFSHLWFPEEFFFFLLFLLNLIYREYHTIAIVLNSPTYVSQLVISFCLDWLNLVFFQKLDPSSILCRPSSSASLPIPMLPFSFPATTFLLPWIMPSQPPARPPLQIIMQMANGIMPGNLPGFQKTSPLQPIAVHHGRQMSTSLPPLLSSHPMWMPRPRPLSMRWTSTGMCEGQLLGVDLPFREIQGPQLKSRGWMRWWWIIGWRNNEYMLLYGCERLRRWRRHGWMTVWVGSRAKRMILKNCWIVALSMLSNSSLFNFCDWILTCCLFIIFVTEFWLVAYLIKIFFLEIRFFFSKITNMSRKIIPICHSYFFIALPMSPIDLLFVLYALLILF